MHIFTLVNVLAVQLVLRIDWFYIFVYENENERILLKVKRQYNVPIIILPLDG